MDPENLDSALRGSSLETSTVQSSHAGRSVTVAHELPLVHCSEWDGSQS